MLRTATKDDLASIPDDIKYAILEFQEPTEETKNTPFSKFLRELSLHFGTPAELSNWDIKLQKELSGRIGDDPELNDLTNQFRRFRAKNIQEAGEQGEIPEKEMQGLASRYAKRIGEIFSETYGVESPEIHLRPRTTEEKRGGFYVPDGDITIFFDPTTRMSDIKKVAIHELRHALQNCIRNYGNSDPDALSAAEFIEDEEFRNKEIAKLEKWIDFTPRDFPPEYLDVLHEYGRRLEIANRFYDHPTIDTDSYSRNLLERDARANQQGKAAVVSKASTEFGNCLEVPFNQAMQYFEKKNGEDLDLDETFVSEADVNNLLKDDSISRRWELLPQEERLDLMEKTKSGVLSVSDLICVIGRFDINVLGYLQTSQQFNEWMTWLSTDQQTKLRNWSQEGVFYSQVIDALQLISPKFEAVDRVFGLGD